MGYYSQYCNKLHSKQPNLVSKSNPDLIVAIGDENLCLLHGLLYYFMNANDEKNWNLLPYFVHFGIEMNIAKWQNIFYAIISHLIR